MKARGGFVCVMLAALLGAGLLTAAPAFAVAPTITSFTPTSGKLNTPVTITGTGFSSPATVKFAGVAATVVTVRSATTILANVPLAAPSGRISVTTTGGTATSTGTFTVTPGAFVNAAATGPPTSARTLSFSGYGPYEAVDVYFDTTDIALVTTDGNGIGSYTFTVPATASPGTHYVSAVGRHSGIAAQTAFTVRTDWPEYAMAAGRRAANPWENTLGASNLTSLEEQWRVYPGNAVESTPAIVGGVVYDGFLDGTVRALDETTGVQKWSHPIGATVRSSPAVVNGTVYVGADDGGVYALNAATGAQRWRTATGAAVTSSPVVVGSTVYVGSRDDTMYALDTQTGAIDWTYQLGGAIEASPAVFAGSLFVGSDAGDFVALNAGTGTLEWTQTLGGAVATPVVAGATVYVGDTGGDFYALDASFGSALWHQTFTFGVDSGAAVAGGTVYFTTTDGALFAFDTATGSEDWSTALRLPLTGGASVANGVVYVTGAGVTFAVNGATGAELRSFGAGSTGGYAVVTDGSLTIGAYFGRSLVHYSLAPTASVSRPRPSALRPDRSLRPER